MSLVQLSDVRLVRGGRVLIDGLSVTLEAGEALHLIGPNGTGKSSLIRLIAGLLKAEAGEVTVSAPVALADDGIALDRTRPLGESLAFWGGDVAAGTYAMDIAHLADLPVRLLSTGQLRRARLARVIASAAPIWLLDEPMNGLDADGLSRLEQAIADHRAIGGAVIAASHQPLGQDWRTLAIGAGA